MIHDPASSSRQPHQVVDLSYAARQNGNGSVIQVEVRKKRTFVKRESSPEQTPPDSAAAAPQPQAGDCLGATPSDEKPPTAQSVSLPPFVPVSTVPCEPPAWQVMGLLRKTGVTMLIAPPGACSTALSFFFTGYLAGKIAGPFGAVRYPGDVLFTTHTPGLDRSLRASLLTPIWGDHKVFTRQTRRRFNWKAPAISLKDVTSDRKAGELAAVVIDAGVLAKGVDDAIVESAYVALSELAETLDCLVIVVVESTSRSVDPFERVPPSLRNLRGSLLAVPLCSKVLLPQPSAPPEFLLLRLADASATALTVRFALYNVWDPVEASRIEWAPVNYDDPRAALRRAETADLTTAERIAVTIARDAIQAKGQPLNTSELQAVGRLQGVARTTMRDALTIAGVAGHLSNVRFSNARHYWVIPGVTPLVRW